MINSIRTRLVFSIVLCSLLFVESGYAQLCAKDKTPETISPSNYAATENGELIDKTNPLIWRRCFWGQQWDNANQSCSGTPKKLNWQIALKTAQQNGWRLPNVKELLAITDLQCFAPPMHPELFPDAPASLASGMWTSTPVQTNITSGDTSTSAWIVDLAHGKLSHHSVNQLNFIILVKNQ